MVVLQVVLHVEVPTGGITGERRVTLLCGAATHDVTCGGAGSRKSNGPCQLFQTNLLILWSPYYLLHCRGGSGEVRLQVPRRSEVQLGEGDSLVVLGTNLA